VGQKVSPIGLRVGIIRDWESKWYAEKEYGTLLLEDVKIREYLKGKLKDSAVSRFEIERAANRVNVTIHTAKPGMVIGKGGAEVEVIRGYLTKLTGKKVHINISEIKTPDLDAILVAESIAQQLERRVSFRRAMKQAIQRTMRMGAKGIKVSTSAVWAALRSLVRKATAKVRFRCIHCVRTSTTELLKHTRHTAVSALKYGFIVEKFFQLRRRKLLRKEENKSCWYLSVSNTGKNIAAT